MAKEYPVVCTSCGAEVLAPFVPTPGRVLECPACLIIHSNMAKSAYVKKLVAFLNEKLGLARGDMIDVVRARGGLCNVTLTKKGKEPELIATIEWAPKDAQRLMMPNMAVANIQSKSPTLPQETITEFVRKFGSESDIPPGTIQRF